MLDWRDFERLFTPLAAGNPRESLYFLPLVFDYLRGRRESYEQLIGSFILWAKRNCSQLRGLEAWGYMSAEMFRLLRSWTAEFAVTHYDRDACKKKGWSLEYDDVVRDSQSVAELIHDLVGEGVLADVAVRFVLEISEAHSVPEAAWFLEVARWQMEGPFNRITGEGMPVEAREKYIEFIDEARSVGWLSLDEAEVEAMLQAGARSDAVRSDAILDLVHDRRRLVRAAGVILDSTLLAAWPTYWRDTLHCLGVDL